MSLQDIDRDILDDDLRIWILSNDQRVQRKSKIDSVRSFFEARLERSEFDGKQVETLCGQSHLE